MGGDPQVAGSMGEIGVSGGGEAYPRCIGVECGDENLDKNGKSIFCDNILRTNKYPSWLLFLPMNLWEQYHKAANIFFLMICIMAMIPLISAFDYTPTLAAIVFLLAIQACKDGYEDYQRIKADKVSNAHPATRWDIHTRTWSPTTWADLQVGDYLLIKCDEAVPADVLILASRAKDPAKGINPNFKEQGIVKIDTAQLDGETNLKQQQALSQTCKLVETPDWGEVQKQIKRIRCDGPDKNLEKLNGALEMNGGTHPLSRNNFLLRGVTVRQTFEVYAIVTHSGDDTKIIRNNDGEPPKKVTHMAALLNQCTMLCFALTFSICFLLCIGMGVWTSSNSDKWYLLLEDSNLSDGNGYFKPSNGGLVAILGFFTWVQLMAYIIPIPLYVTIEMIKLFLGYFTDWDITMYSEELDKTAKCRNSSVPEELGQVQYVLSDKTGTLTQNKMELLKFSCGGKAYGSGITEIEATRHRLTNPTAPPLVDVSLDKPQYDHEDKNFRFYDTRVSNFAFEEADAAESEAIKGFLLALALCHEVVPETMPDGSIKYNAPSPDDGALCVGAKNLGFRLTSSGNDPSGIGKALVVNTTRKKGKAIVHEDETYVLLQTIGFDSDRKRMSCVVRLPSGQVRVFMKGADNYIRDRLAPEHKTSALCLDTMDHIATFGDDGLRTLLYSARDLEDEFYQKWSQQWEEAALIVNEEEKANMQAELATHVEEGHYPVGASAIEDKLQVNVGDTITHLAEAGIQTWVLTGDKTNTAIMIGFAVCLLNERMERVIIKEDMQEGNAGYRIANLLVEATDYYMYGRKRCQILGKEEQGPVWYRENHPWTDDGPPARCADICEEAYKNLQTEQKYRQKINPLTQEVELDADGAAIMVDAYVPFHPMSCSSDGKLALVIEGAALTQIGIGRKAIKCKKTGKMIDLNCGSGAKDKAMKHGIEEDQLDPEYRWAEQFTDFAKECKAVICCRVSPNQKAEVTKCVKQFLKKTTLCIGDGANDVAMILEAHIGVGIAGVEGSQAVNNADFALTKFCDLERLVLCHGRWAYRRLGLACVYILYKNIAFCLIFALYAFYSGFSGQLLYDEWALSFYNILFTGAPVLFYGLFEQDVSPMTSRNFPMIYRPGQTDAVFNLRVFGIWLLEAFWDAFVIFFFCFNIIGYREMTDGHHFSIWDAGNAAFTANVWVVTIRLAFDTLHFTVFHHVTYWGSIALWYIFIIPYCAIAPGKMPMYDLNDNMYYSFDMLAQSVLFWVSQLVTIAVALLPTAAVYGWYIVMTPSLSDKNPSKYVPNARGDLSMMYHLRHYMKYPAKYVDFEEKKREIVNEQKRLYTHVGVLSNEHVEETTPIEAPKWQVSNHSSVAYSDAVGSGSGSANATVPLSTQSSGTGKDDAQVLDMDEGTVECTAIDDKDSPRPEF